MKTQIVLLTAQMPASCKGRYEVLEIREIESLPYKDKKKAGLTYDKIVNRPFFSTCFGWSSGAPGTAMYRAIRGTIAAVARMQAEGTLIEGLDFLRKKLPAYAEMEAAMKAEEAAAIEEAA
jgi:hypothetical protein